MFRAFSVLVLITIVNRLRDFKVDKGDNMAD